MKLTAILRNRCTIFGLLSAMFLFPACTAEREERSGNVPAPILFAPTGLTVQGSTVTESRAVNEFINTDGSSFGVSNYLQSGGVVTAGDMDNQRVTYDALRNRYSYDPVVPWPANSADKLGFLAYYPYTDNPAEYGLSVTTGPPDDPSLAFEIEVSTDPSRQIDLLVGYSEFRVMHTPVRLDFIHALSNLLFTGHSTPTFGNSSLRVTRLLIHNVNCRGSFTYRAGTYPDWTLSADPEDIGTVDLHTGNGLTGNYLNTSFGTSLHDRVANSGTGIVLLPQSTEDIVVEIHYTVPEIPYEMVKLIPLKETGVAWEPGNSYSYTIRFDFQGVFLSTEITPWNDVEQSASLDGQYYLRVSDSELLFDRAGETLQMTAETNYDGAYVGLPAGLAVREADIEYLPAVSPGEEWLTLAFASSASGGVHRGELSVTASANGTGAVRTAKIFIVSGNMHYTVHVTQQNP